MPCDYCGGTEDVVEQGGEMVCAPCNEAAAAVRRVKKMMADVEERAGGDE